MSHQHDHDHKKDHKHEHKQPTVHLVADQTDLDDYCGPERQQYVNCLKTGTTQACSAQYSNYTSCGHHFLKEVNKLKECTNSIAAFDDCRKQDSRSDCRDLAKNVHNCYLKL